MSDSAGPKSELDADAIAALSQFEQAPTIISEALFGYRYARPYLDGLPEGARVLEIGSGPCILLAHVSGRHPGLGVTGIEPVGPGFEKFRPVIARLKSRYAFDLFEGAYEAYASPETFDLIYSVNVFEHVDDWRHCLGFIAQHLKPGGTCILLCPNYTFPYEPHFKFPVIFNKAVTHALFRKRIAQFETEHDAEGLWSSLNFVTLRAVERAAPEVGLELRYHASVVEDMIARLNTDAEFQKRQKVIGAAAKLLKRAGLMRLMTSHALRHAHPYMLLELSKR